MTLLRQIKEQNLFAFKDSFETWEDAVYASCEQLITNGYISNEYAQSIVDNVKEHGPYIILVPGIAMPHSTQDAKGVFKTGISMMKVKERVYFEDGDEKYATLFFTLAAEDNDQHLNNIQQLMELLMNEEVIATLQCINSEEALIQYLETQ